VIVWLTSNEAALPSGDDWLVAREARRVGSMRFTKRHVEYLLARWTAKAALARRLDLPADVRSFARLEIRNAADGAPEAWLDERRLDISLSLTDRAGWAVCALAPPAVGLGCDLELVEPRSPAFVRDYLTEPECRMVARGRSEDERHLRANLVWSAKESALKVLRTGLRRDTRSVEVDVGVAGDADDTSTLDQWQPLVVRAVEGRTFPGWWRRYGAFVLTFATDVATPPPTAMLEPTALATGVPTESWRRAPLR
jgi:4'-phosphopantetheinyl transferase